jgi:hypothetical protein
LELLFVKARMKLWWSIPFEAWDNHLRISTYSQYKTLKDIPAEVAKYLPRKEEIVKRLSG